MENTLITKDRLDELVRLCKETPHGYGMELGVYKGGSLVTLGLSFPDRVFIGIDTFSGLPEKDWSEDEIHKPGDFSDNSIQSVLEFFVEKNVKNCGLYQGYFPDCSSLIEDKDPVTFVHVDFDFYEGAKSAIDYFYPRLPKGGIMVFDDFEWPNCPGVKKALDESGLKYQPTRAKFQAYLIKE